MRKNIKPLNRLCEIDDNVLRQLVLKVHPSLIEPILAHATQTEEEPPEAEQPQTYSLPPKTRPSSQRRLPPSRGR